MGDQLSLQKQTEIFKHSPILSALWRQSQDPAKNKFQQIHFWNPKSQSFSGLNQMQYFARILALAQRMTKLGLRPKDKVLLHLNNSLEWDLIEKACFLLNLNISSVESHAATQSVKDVLDLIKPRLVFSESPDSFLNLKMEFKIDFSNIVFSFRDSNQSHPDFNSQPWDMFFSDSKVALASDLDGLNVSHDFDNSVCYTLFTSGSTGKPKCVTYTQKQILNTCYAILNHEGGWRPFQKTLSWLPMSNLFQRITNLCSLLNYSKVYIFHPPTEVLTALKIVRPSVFIAVPRFYDKIYETFLRLQKKLAWTSPWFQRFVLRILFQRLFKKDVVLFSGSAALRKPTQDFFEWLGFPILEAYGLTECILPVAMNTLTSHRPGSVGKPLLGNTLSFSEGSEILLSGDFVSEAATDGAGVLRTGDIGFIDRDGFLHLKDRMSKMIKLSTGRKIYREVIENSFFFDEKIDHFLIFGNEKPFLVALVTLKKGFVPDSKWNEELSQYIEQMNSKLNSPEKIRSYRVIHRPLSMDQQELTSNLKVRYAVVEKNFLPEINQQYTA